MISKLKQSDLLRFATTMVAAVCGMLAISLLEIGILLRSAESKLGQDDVQLLNEIGSIQDESHTVLTAMNASRDHFCSDAEIAYFRKLIFNSEYLRDAGRMRDGRIECSTALGRENLPGTQFQPSVSLPDGSAIYRDISPYQSHDGYTFGQQSGDSYVVFDPREIGRMDSINVNRTTTFIDPVHHQLRHPGHGLPLKAGVVTDRNWQGKAGNLLLATRCDAIRPVCVTTYITIPVSIERLARPTYRIHDARWNHWRAPGTCLRALLRTQPEHGEPASPGNRQRRVASGLPANCESGQPEDCWG